MDNTGYLREEKENDIAEKSEEISRKTIVRKDGREEDGPRNNIRRYFAYVCVVINSK